MDLGNKQNRLAGSIFAQVYNKLGEQVPDVDDAAVLAGFFDTTQALNADGKLLAYHDRSDGGLLATLAEMSFASHKGLNVDLTELTQDSTGLATALFNEELGAVIQVAQQDLAQVKSAYATAGVTVIDIAELNDSDELIFTFQGNNVLSGQRIDWQRTWSRTSYEILALRDNPSTSEQEFDNLLDATDPCLSASL